jgi:hypothetical protein
MFFHNMHLNVCRCLTSFLIGEMVLVMSQKSKTNWRSPSSKASNQHFHGSPRHLLSFVRLTKILFVMTLDKRYDYHQLLKICNIERVQFDLALQLEEHFCRASSFLISLLQVVYKHFTWIQEGSTFTQCL